MVAILSEIYGSSLLPLDSSIRSAAASDGDADFQEKLLSAMRYGFGGHLEKSAK